MGGGENGRRMAAARPSRMPLDSPSHHLTWTSCDLRSLRACFDPGAAASDIVATRARNSTKKREKETRPRTGARSLPLRSFEG